MVGENASSTMVELNTPNPQPIEYLDPEKYKLTGDQRLNDALRAADAHRRIRYKLHEILKPGASLFSIIDAVEENTRILLAGERNNGIGFPCGVNLNNCAAHFSLNPGDRDLVLTEKDVLKIDFGVHSNGRIMDSAFSVCFDPKYQQLLRASKEATVAGLKVIGVDMMVSEIGREINEVFKSFEIELGGKTVPIKPVYNLNGHSIEQYKIHGGVSIPPFNNHDHARISEGFCAIETFATTGNGEVNDFGDCSHYMMNALGGGKKIYNQKNQEVLDIIKSNMGTLPFSPKHVDFYTKGSLTSIKLLTLRGFLDPYPPLYDSPNSMIAQFEHTVYLADGKKEILTVGEDY